MEKTQRINLITLCSPCNVSVDALICSYLRNDYEGIKLSKRAIRKLCVLILEGKEIPRKARIIMDIWKESRSPKEYESKAKSACNKYGWRYP